MENITVQILESERQKIKHLLLAENSNHIDIILSQKQLMHKIETCEVVNMDSVLPKHVISLGKTFSIRTAFGSKIGIKIVSPELEDLTLNKYSVLSPLGCTLFGHKTGDVVKWHTNNFIEHIEILAVNKI